MPCHASRVLRDLLTPTPAISVIMPARDMARFIGVAVDSLRAQDFEDWELLVVDDGSRDGTGAVVAARRDARIRLIRQPPSGVSVARSRALSEARGGAILFLDADDWVAPDALARLSAALDQAPEAVGAHGGYAVMAEEAGPGDPPLRLRPGPLPAGELLETLLVRNLFANGGHLLLRREAVQRAGPFRAELRYGEDWEYWIRLALQGPYAAAPGAAPVLFMRQRHGSAYHRMARDPAAFAPAMAAIFGNAELAERLGPQRLAALRRRSEAENAWIVGRELIRHGERAAGLEQLRASVVAAPSAKRAVLLAAAHAMPVLPRRLHGPFIAYPG
jgi:glycosyltransferase involved in cell wall biosynthesis